MVQPEDITAVEVPSGTKGYRYQALQQNKAANKKPSDAASRTPDKLDRTRISSTEVERMEESLRKRYANLTCLHRDTAAKDKEAGTAGASSTDGQNTAGADEHDKLQSQKDTCIVGVQESPFSMTVSVRTTVDQQKQTCSPTPLKSTTMSLQVLEDPPTTLPNKYTVMLGGSGSTGSADIPESHQTSGTTRKDHVIKMVGEEQTSSSSASTNRDLDLVVLENDASTRVLASGERPHLSSLKVSTLVGLPTQFALGSAPIGSSAALPSLEAASPGLQCRGIELPAPAFFNRTSGITAPKLSAKPPPQTRLLSRPPVHVAPGVNDKVSTAGAEKKKDQDDASDNAGEKSTEDGIKAGTLSVRGAEVQGGQTPREIIKIAEHVISSGTGLIRSGGAPLTLSGRSTLNGSGSLFNVLQLPRFTPSLASRTPLLSGREAGLALLSREGSSAAVPAVSSARNASGANVTQVQGHVSGSPKKLDGAVPQQRSTSSSTATTRILPTASSSKGSTVLPAGSPLASSTITGESLSPEREELGSRAQQQFTRVSNAHGGGIGGGNNIFTHFLRPVNTSSTVWPPSSYPSSTTGGLAGSLGSDQEEKQKLHHIEQAILERKYREKLLAQQGKQTAGGTRNQIKLGAQQQQPVATKLQLAVKKPVLGAPLLQPSSTSQKVEGREDASSASEYPYYEYYYGNTTEAKSADGEEEGYGELSRGEGSFHTGVEYLRAKRSETLDTSPATASA
ncbi:unnamed protein product [Amoebophrya sp. A25]|nr:unnamed protein product [Amoebophrya sp. A25]|eukprot:GSA25T00000275001.1